jgi:hypothetical protein
MSLSELETANINFLELQTVYLGLGCFLEELYDKHVKICSDNSTAVAYINNFGGTKYMSCNFFQLTNLSILRFSLDANRSIFKLIPNFKFCKKILSLNSAWAVDAFTLTWNNIMFYAFPPFSIIDKVCHKIMVDRAEGVLNVPSWPTQNWYPLVMKLCLKPPYFISDKLCC